LWFKKEFEKNQKEEINNLKETINQNENTPLQAAYIIKTFFCHEVREF